MISHRGFPLQAGRRWVMERLNARRDGGFTKLLVCAERGLRVIEALLALANSIIVIGRLVRTAWTTR